MALKRDQNAAYRGQYQVTLFDVAGPAHRLMYWAALAQLVPILLPVVLDFFPALFTECEEKKHAASYSSWLWCYFLFWLAIMLFFEASL